MRGRLTSDLGSTGLKAKEGKRQKSTVGARPRLQVEPSAPRTMTNAERRGLKREGRGGKKREGEGKGLRAHT